MADRITVKDAERAVIRLAAQLNTTAAPHHLNAKELTTEKRNWPGVIVDDRTPGSLALGSANMAGRYPVVVTLIDMRYALVGDYFGKPDQERIYKWSAIVTESDAFTGIHYTPRELSDALYLTGRILDASGTADTYRVFYGQSDATEPYTAAYHFTRDILRNLHDRDLTVEEFGAAVAGYLNECGTVPRSFYGQDGIGNIAEIAERRILYPAPLTSR